MINLSNILISDSFADTVSNSAEFATNSPQAGLMNFVPLILIFMVFYFLLVRPQQKKMKEHQKTLNRLKNGDKVQTSSGIFGTIESIDDKENVVELEIATNVTIKIAKYSISSVLNQKTPVHKSNKK
jgi:preprotein translocase subunit YajC